MRYICEICGYQAEEREQESRDAVQSWSCPVCGSDRELFYPDTVEEFRQRYDG